MRIDIKKIEPPTGTDKLLPVLFQTEHGEHWLLANFPLQPSMPVDVDWVLFKGAAGHPAKINMFRYRVAADTGTDMLKMGLQLGCLASFAARDYARIRQVELERLLAFYVAPSEFVPGAEVFFGFGVQFDP